MKLEFGVLGPLAVRRAGRPIQIPGRRQRALLALLLLHANEPLSLDALIDGLWRGDVPRSAPKIIRNAVSALRRVLESDDGAEQVLLTRPRGYELQIDPDQLDAARFDRLARAGREALAAGDAAAAADELREALALWRGAPLAELTDEPFADAEIGRLEELRLTALEDRIEADLALGRHAELVGELESLTARHPYRERLRGHQMLALYRAGRQADALDVYRKMRRLLVDELGIEPGRGVQELERAILLQDAELELAAPPAAEPRGAAAEAPPRPVHEVRKTVSVVVADVVVLGAPRDPEATRPPIARALDRVVEVFERHGGSVDRSLATVVTAVFGIPVVHEDDPLRAARAALESRDAVAALADQLERDWQTRLAVRAAVHTGPVVVGVGPGDHEVVAGDAVGRALRLQHAAGPDEILIDDATRDFADYVLDVERAGTAWRLRALVERPLSALQQSPLVGRETELAQLEQAFRIAVRERRPYLFTILGPAGIGKSRLASEFVSRRAREATAVVGRAAPYGERSTLGPVADIVRQLGGTEPESAVADVLAHEPDGAAVAVRVAAAAGLVEQSTPREEACWAVRRLFETLARTRPLIVVFEDLQWADPTLLELVAHVADRARDAPILLVCVARPELLDASPSWGGGQVASTSVLLGPLGETESARLLEQLAAGTGVDPRAAAAAAEVAEGNPFFLEQMLAMLRDRGDAGGAPQVPPTIQAVLAARLDRLEPGPRAVLERAAVIGREFARAAVVELSPEDDSSVDAHLDALVRRELIDPQRSVSPAERAFRFRHVLLRDAAYDSVPKQARAELHERYASWLERAGTQRAPDVDEALGYHLEQAHRYRVELAPPDDDARLLAARAAERLTAAGRRAYASGSPAAAAALLSRAAGLVDAGEPRRAELLVDLGDALRESGDLEAADAVLADAAAVAVAAADEVLEAQVEILRLRLELQRDHELKTDELLAGAQRARAVLERHGDDAKLAKAWELLAWVPWFRCRAGEAEAALQRALEHARRAGDTRTEAQTLNLLIGAMWFGPTTVAEGIRRCEETLAQPHVQRRTRASVLRALAGFAAMEGRFDDARAAIADCRAILQDLGLRVTEAHVAETVGIVELLAGDAEAAERELRAGYDSVVEMGDAVVTAVLAALLAQALYAQGRDAEALAFSDVSAEAAAPDDISAHVQWRAARAKALARTGRPGEADAVARDAVARAARTDFLVVHGDALLDLAEVLRLGGREQDAVAAASDALVLYRRKGNVVAAERARAFAAASPAVTDRSGS